jgi:hypothetical protein
LPQLGNKSGFQPARAWSKKENRHGEINIRTMSYIAAAGYLAVQAP